MPFTPLHLIVQSIETVKCDGSGRYTFWDVFKGKTARTLAVFEGMFYWADEKYLWQIDLNEPKQSKFILKASSPHMIVYHSLQQPQGKCWLAEDFTVTVFQEWVWLCRPFFVEFDCHLVITFNCDDFKLPILRIKYALFGQGMLILGFLL